MGKPRLKTRSFRAHAFPCLRCGAVLSGLTDPDVDKTGGEAFTICLYCAAVYRSDVAVAAIRRGESANWQFVPDASVPPDVAAEAATLRANMRRSQN